MRSAASSLKHEEPQTAFCGVRAGMVTVCRPSDSATGKNQIRAHRAKADVCFFYCTGTDAYSAASTRRGSCLFTTRAVQSMAHDACHIHNTCGGAQSTPPVKEADAAAARQACAAA